MWPPTIAQKSSKPKEINFSRAIFRQALNIVELLVRGFSSSVPFLPLLTSFARCFIYEFIFCQESKSNRNLSDFPELKQIVPILKESNCWAFPSFRWMKTQTRQALWKGQMRLKVTYYFLQNKGEMWVFLTGSLRKNVCGNIYPHSHVILGAF